MGTEIAISFTSLRNQLENEKSSLFKIDENIKKIVQTSGRFSNDRFNQSSHYIRGGPQSGGRNSYLDFKNYKPDDQLGKRKTETKTVFSRLSVKDQDSDGDDDLPSIKRAKVPSAVCRELPTRAAVLRAQGDDEQARTRNRRIFGSLLGTLQKFKQEEIVLQTKEEKKAQVERKIEEQARVQKEKEQKERKTLFAERENKKATIKALEVKMARVEEYEKWEKSQKDLANFILTKTRPHIYWLPKKMTEKATEKLNSSRKYHEKCMIKRRVELQVELQRIEYRCLRRGLGTKENHQNHSTHTQSKEVKKENREDSENLVTIKNEEDTGRKRNKFAMDVDEKEREDSDGDDRPDEVKKDKPEEEIVKENDENIMDTNTEQQEVTEVVEIGSEVAQSDENTNVESEMVVPASEQEPIDNEHSQ